jgi:hypothetical protein
MQAPEDKYGYVLFVASDAPCQIFVRPPRQAGEGAQDREDGLYSRLGRACDPDPESGGSLQVHVSDDKQQPDEALPCAYARATGASFVWLRQRVRCARASASAHLHGQRRVGHRCSKHSHQIEGYMGPNSDALSWHA